MRMPMVVPAQAQVRAVKGWAACGKWSRMPLLVRAQARAARVRVGGSSRHRSRVQAWRRLRGRIAKKGLGMGRTMLLAGGLVGVPVATTG